MKQLNLWDRTLEIIFRVYLKECIGGIARATTITAISLIGLTAMAGAVGAGGIGDFAIRFGYQRNQIDVTYVSCGISPSGKYYTSYWQHYS